MRTMMAWTWVILGMGMALSDVLLSWEWWVAPAQVAGEGVLAQESRPVASPVLRSRFVRPVPPGWTAPSLVGTRDRPDEPWRTGWAQLGLPGAAPGPRLGVEPAGEAVPSVGRAAGARLGPPPLAASVRRALPPPQVSLVKDVRETMPQLCDDKLFRYREADLSLCSNLAWYETVPTYCDDILKKKPKKWQCNLACFAGGRCRGSFSLTFSRDFDSSGYQRIRMKENGSWIASTALQIQPTKLAVSRSRRSWSI